MGSNPCLQLNTTGILITNCNRPQKNVCKLVCNHQPRISICPPRFGVCDVKFDKSHIKTFADSLCCFCKLTGHSWKFGHHMIHYNCACLCCSDQVHISTDARLLNHFFLAVINYFNCFFIHVLTIYPLR